MPLSSVDCQVTGFSLLKGVPPPTKNLLIPSHLEKLPPNRLPPPPNFIPSAPKVNSPPLNKNVQVIITQ